VRVRRALHAARRRPPVVRWALIAPVVYAVVLPFVALATVYVYFDMRVRDELADEASTDTLPAEVSVSI
jgi:hypothetical protein